MNKHLLIKNIIPSPTHKQQQISITDYYKKHKSTCITKTQIQKTWIYFVDNKNHNANKSSNIKLNKESNSNLLMIALILVPIGPFLIAIIMRWALVIVIERGILWGWVLTKESVEVLITIMMLTYILKENPYQ